MADLTRPDSADRYGDEIDMFNGHCRNTSSLGLRNAEKIP